MMPATCPPAIVTPTITVTRAEIGITLDSGLSIAALTRKAGHAGENLEVRGLTVNNLSRQVSLTLEGSASPDDPARACYRVTGVAITIQPSSTIYTASEYPPGSCAYNAVLTHEKRHVASFLDALWRYRTQVRDTVWSTVWRLNVQGPFDKTEAQAFVDDLRTRINEALIPSDENLLARDRGLQEKIDNAGEYANVARQIDQCLWRGR